MKKIILILGLVVLASCASYTVGTEDLVAQLKANQELNRISNVAKDNTLYASNPLEKIRCINKDGEKVWLYPNKNVNFVLQKKDGKNVTIYYDTAVFDQDTIRGLNSRILIGSRSFKKISVKDIKTVKITTEGGKTEKIN